MRELYKYMYAHDLQDPNDKGSYFVNDEMREAINDPAFNVKIRNPDVMKIVHKILYPK